MFEAFYGTSFAAAGSSFEIAAFMTSFSTHAGDGDFERENGLWSQWERYAGADGYCIVFDTATMCDLLGAEFNGSYWVRLALGSVRYSGPPDSDRTTHARADQRRRGMCSVSSCVAKNFRNSLCPSSSWGRRF